MQRLEKQRGMTGIGWLLVLLIILVTALIFIKLVPMYMDNFKVTSALESLKTDQQARGKQPHEIKKLLLNRFNIDMLPQVAAEDITVTRQENTYNVRVETQFKENMFGGLYVVLLVDEAVEIPLQ